VGGNAGARQVEPVGVPAGGDGRIVDQPFARVPGAGGTQQVEGRSRDPQVLGPQGDGEPGRAWAMVGIVVVVEPHGVVKKGEWANHGHVGPGPLGEPDPVPFYARPVLQPVDRTQVGRGVLQHQLKDAVKIRGAGTTVHAGMLPRPVGRRRRGQPDTGWRRTVRSRSGGVRRGSDR